VPPVQAHVALAAFDMAESGDPAKTNDIQLATMEGLRSILCAAVDGASIGWRRCCWLDRGDGGVLVAPGDAEHCVVDPLVHHLAAELRRYNRRCSDLARIRLRMAAHSGLVLASGDGIIGMPLVHLARLLDAPPLRRQLETGSADLAVLVSDPLYDRIVRPDHGLIDPASFRPVDVEVKETSARAWLLLPGPLLPGPDAQPPRPFGEPLPARPGHAAVAAAGNLYVSIGTLHGTVVGPLAVDTFAGRDLRPWAERPLDGTELR
jgi:class 3 adenylate cyclase